MEEFAQAESRDQGMTISFAKSMVIPRSILNLRFFANSSMHHYEQWVSRSRQIGKVENDLPSVKIMPAILDFTGHITWMFPGQ